MCFLGVTLHITNVTSHCTKDHTHITNITTVVTKVDWSLLKADYATGAFTDAALARKYGISRESVTRKRCIDRKHNPDAWPQNLEGVVQSLTALSVAKADTEAAKPGKTAAIIHKARKEADKNITREAVDEKVTHMIAEAVESRVGQYTEVMLAAVETNKQVIMGHKQDAAKLRVLVANMTNEIAASAMLAEDMELLAQILAGSGADFAEENKARMTVMKALNMNQRVSSLKTLSDALKNLIAIEREAYNIDPKRDREPDVGDLSDDELAKKLAKYGITLPSP